MRKLHAYFPNLAADSEYFVAVLRAMRGLEWLEMDGNTEGPLTRWWKAEAQAEICPSLNTLIITHTTICAVGRCVQARDRAGVPIARVEVGSWDPMRY